MPVVKDRRSSLRVEVEGQARIHTNRDAFVARCVDLGLDGIAVRSTRAARPGELVTLELQIDGQRLRIEARLARRQRTRGEYLLGLAFVELDLDTQRRVEHTIFERLAGSPQGEFMRAFVAHADRVPPPVVRGSAVEHTVVAGTLMVPVISGHTQVIALDQLPTVDRTVIAPPPPRTDIVRAEAPAPPPGAPGAPDDAWLDDEMHTAQFRLLEAAQAGELEVAEREASEVELELEPELLEPEAPPAEHTVVVTSFSTPPGESLALTESLPRERTLVTSDSLERRPAEQTVPLRPAERVSEVPAERTLPFLRDLPDPAPHNPTDSLLASTERTAIVTAQPAADSALRPTVRALLDAAALLRGPDPARPGRRGPRVVVSIPHGTHRRIASTPWNRK
jgi:hypothetical protein